MVTATVPVGASGGNGERFMARRALAWVAANAANAAAAGPATVPVIDLSADDLDRSAAPHIIRAMIEALDRGETHYTDRSGIAPLREALAARVAAEDGVAYEAKGEVLICGGGREALFVATQMIVEPGDEGPVADPPPASFAEGVRLAGGVPVTVPTGAENGFALTAGAVAARLTPRT